MFRYVISILFLATLMVACSGGGGQSENPQEPEPQVADLQTSVPEPTYVANSPALAYFNLINQIRQEHGLGLLAQSTQLDEVARRHAAYLDASASGNELVTGIEDPQKSGFSGVSAQDRCDLLSYEGTCLLTELWSEMFFIFRPTPYLGLQILNQGVRQVGIAMHSTVLFTGMYNGPEIQMAVPSGMTRQRQAAGFVLVARLWGGVHVQINEGETLIHDALHVWDALGNEIAGTVLTAQTDPNHRVPGHALMFLPATGGLNCDGGTYTIHFSGMRNGVPFSVTRSLAPDQFC